MADSLTGPRMDSATIRRYGFAVAIFGGFAPLICAGLISLTGDPLAPAYYVIGSGVLSFIATIFITERAGRALPDEMASPLGPVAA